MFLMFVKNTKIFIYIIFVLFIPFTSFASEINKIKIQLKWTHQFQFAGYYVAKEKGFYKERNLDVTLIEGGINIDVHSVVAEQKAEFGVLGSELVLFKSKYSDLVVLAPIIQHSIRAIITNRDKGIITIKDLFDTKIELNTNELPEFQAMFNNEGIDIKKLHISNKNKSSISRFINGELSAFNGSIANQPFLLEKENININLIRPIDYGIDFYGDTLFTTRNVINKDPEIVQGIIEATIKGWNYAFNNPDETIDIIIDKYKPSKSREHLYFEYVQLKKLVRPDLVEIGHNNKERWDRIKNTYIDLGLLNPDFTLDGFFYEPNIERERIIQRVIKISIILLISLLVSIIIILFFNRQLRLQVIKRTSELENNKKMYKDLAVDLDITFNAIGDGIIVANLDGKIVKMNNVAENLTGWNLGDALNKPLTDVFYVINEKTSIQDKGFIDKFISQNLNKFTKESLLINTINKKSYNITYSITPKLNNDKNYVGIVIIFRDISELHLLNERLSYTTKMEAIGLLTGGISHDFNNMLNGIINASTLLLSSDFNLNIKGQEYLNIILESANRASCLTSQLLISTSKKHYDLNVVDINEVIEKSQVLLLSKMKRDVALKIKLNATKSLIKGDIPSLIDVVLNITTNSIESILDRGEIVIETENLEIDQEYCNSISSEMYPGTYIIIEVQDNGVGISRDHLKKIFDPFFSTKRLGKGLGLSLASGIIKSHHGTIKVYSKEDKGSNFQIMLPCI